MSSTAITWEVPENLYRELIKVQHDLAYPQLGDLIAQAVQRYIAEVEAQSWQQEFRSLQKAVRQQGGFTLGTTKEEVITHLREQRQQLFEAEYAHLYR